MVPIIKIPIESDWSKMEPSHLNQSDQSLLLKALKRKSNHQMQCLSSLILLFASFPFPTTAPIIVVLSLFVWQVRNMRPCVFCAVFMYAILVAAILYEECAGGLFDALRLSPDEIELNLLLRAKYVMISRSRSSVLAPIDGFGNFFKAFLRYLLEPSYGKIERI